MVSDRTTRLRARDTREEADSDTSSTVSTSYALTYRVMLEDERIGFAAEPFGTEEAWREATLRDRSMTQIWTGAYLGAFARCAELRLVTLDRALASKSSGAELLGPRMN